MKSIAGSLSWIARNCRPDIAYGVSKVQSAAACGYVKDIKMANKLVKYAVSTAERGITFKSGILDWNNLVQVIVSDASHANEEQVGTTPSGKVKTEPHRSQGGKLILLADPSIVEGDDCKFHLISHSSTLIKRVCRATVQAEAYQLQYSNEEGDRIRAAIAGMRGQLDSRNWEATAAASMRQIWFTDCKSVHDA